ncbi:conserved hypothetical protein [Jonesia denitrificans DSM 20603]|uniref:Integral membrane protein n=1 Tax=Jonesia denitrificans (strain ATCC 14870 / DSM 20603 / BCRC 15368 / CIP 55.134 / JCM 11481 / NBRC 15587 / NCTC 10816 / Prevot 55134) TaxID=471856 RepID=C7R3T5_JONDD|nr:conserved hypothetical protein [Jonesia denitrificans DSM 20603]
MPPPTATRRYPFSRRRIGAMLLGVFLIGVAVGLFRQAALGTDPFTTMNVGVSSLIGWEFAFYQVVFNIGLLGVVLITDRRHIGLGSLFNMVLVGYISTAVLIVLYILSDVPIMPDYTLMWVRVVTLGIAVLLACLGVALYMTAQLGVGPYDALARIISDATGGRLSFRTCRIMTDTLAVLIGGTTFYLSGGHVPAIVGAGTLIMALGTGPLVQFFIDRVAMPWLHRDVPPMPAASPRPISVKE